MNLKFEGKVYCKPQIGPKILNGKIERINLGEINFDSYEDITKIRLNGLEIYEIPANKVLSFYFSTGSRDDLKRRAMRELEKLENCNSFISLREKVEIKELYLEISITLINPENNLETTKLKKINL